jgi:hypothetical protein
MGFPGSTPEQSPDEIHGLVRAAAVQHRSMTAFYDGTRRLLCPHVLGYNQPGEWRVFCYQSGAKPGADHCRLAVRESGAVWR